MTDTIRVLTDIEKVRESPGMYIGDNASQGLFTIIREIIDNAVDEYPNYIDKSKGIDIKYENGIFRVRDYGRGISPYESKQLPGEIEERLAFTKLGAGGKFKSDRDNNGLQIAGGMHGVGSTTTNAMSDFFNVIIYKDGKIFQDKYVDAEPITKLEKSKKHGLTLPVIDKTNETGTEIEFKPSKKYLLTTKVDIDRLKRYLKDISYLNPGLKVNFNEETFYSANGIKDYLEKLTDNKNILHFKGEVPVENAYMYVNIVFNINNTDNLHKAYTNGIYNNQGGTHVQGYNQGLIKILRNLHKEVHKTDLKTYKKKIDYCTKAFNVTDITTMFATSQIPKYTSAIIDLKYSKPMLYPQTKDKLVSTEVPKLLSDYLVNYEINEKTQKQLINLLKLIIDELYDKAKDINDSVKLNKNEMKILTRKKLSAARSEDPTKLELILVEGDSAAGSLKTNRDPEFQAILPLRGKVLNVQKSTTKAAFANQEIATIFVTLFGDQIATARTSENLTHHKIIIGTDQDVDGKHIRVLLLTLFMTFAPDIVEKGHVYLLDTPLFVNKINDSYHYTYSNEEQEAYLKKNKPLTIERNKGLGELDTKQVLETILEPKTRKLTQVTIENIDEILETMDNLMGTNSTFRQNFIMNIL